MDAKINSTISLLKTIVNEHIFRSLIIRLI